MRLICPSTELVVQGRTSAACTAFLSRLRLAAKPASRVSSAAASSEIARLGSELYPNLGDDGLGRAAYRGV